jgi:hypothetical protein
MSRRWLITEKYLGCKQKLRIAVIDHIGIQPDN